MNLTTLYRSIIKHALITRSAGCVMRALNEDTNATNVQFYSLRFNLLPQMNSSIYYKGDTNEKMIDTPSYLDVALTQRNTRCTKHYEHLFPFNPTNWLSVFLPV
jgi:hypothetical protein